MNKFKVKNQDKKKLVLGEKRDYQILRIIYKLEKMKLDKEQKALVKFLKSQLEDDWRKPLLAYVNKLSKKFKK